MAGYRSCCELFIVACDRTLCREVANSPLKLLAGGSLSAGGWGRLSDLYNLQWFMVLTVFVVSWMFIIEWLILLCFVQCSGKVPTLCWRVHVESCPTRSTSSSGVWTGQSMSVNLQDKYMYYFKCPSHYRIKLSILELGLFIGSSVFRVNGG